MDCAHHATETQTTRMPLSQREPDFGIRRCTSDRFQCDLSTFKGFISALCCQLFERYCCETIRGRPLSTVLALKLTLKLGQSNPPHRELAPQADPQPRRLRMVPSPSAPKLAHPPVGEPRFRAFFHAHSRSLWGHRREGERPPRGPSQMRFAKGSPQRS